MDSTGFILPYDQQLNRSPDFTVSVVSVLENSIEFYLEYVFIIKGLNFHLFIRNNNTVLVDQYFATETAAKDAFLEYFGGKGWREDLMPSWSQFFVPDQYWIEFLLSDYKNQTVTF